MGRYFNSTLSACMKFVFIHLLFLTADGTISEERNGTQGQLEEGWTDRYHTRLGSVLLVEEIHIRRDEKERSHWIEGFESPPVVFYTLTDNAPQSGLTAGLPVVVPSGAKQEVSSGKCACTSSTLFSFADLCLRFSFQHSDHHFSDCLLAQRSTLSCRKAPPARLKGKSQASAECIKGLGLSQCAAKEAFSQGCTHLVGGRLSKSAAVF